ncbi:Glutamyl-tRNA(Gln) amidotransferase subunit A [Candidatus Hodgkinia cicadicola]|uniref:Glutamyl-tRNA(Gln) amidotransferase subunit A n=1 Tax=Candidatus Hodgkinia cicadicola TaxID=573658 RepID=A0ABX4MH90_9HYPH|nr:Glutamyl-tRNA(Gln) amidotransferase subunit A [Candidatus Hodgkinia cicadicola]PIM96243.1 Glutamyl-tRNA(Gln) amidotransferase subunit A [Candidatus Hodgkinia cicadicola]
MLSLKLLHNIYTITSDMSYTINFILYERSEHFVWYFGLSCFNQSDKMLKLTRSLSKLYRYSRLPYTASISVLVKDQISIKNMKYELISLNLCNYSCKYNSEVILRIFNSKSIISGKTNMDEFGIGFSSGNSIRAITFTSWSIYSLKLLKLLTLSGGSSGNCAAALSLITTLLAIGSDTGGSIRQPANYNGLIGLKPTYGRCSRWGLVAYSPSLEQIGIMSRTTSDCSYLSSILFGKDNKDWNTFNIPVPKYQLYNNCHENELMILRKHSPCLNTDWTYGLSLINRIGINITEGKLSNIAVILPAYCVLTSVECFSSLSRYNGIRYGLRFKENNPFLLYKKIRSVGYNPDIRRKLMTGIYILSSKLNNFKLYSKALKYRFITKSNLITLIKNKIGLITPVIPHVNLGINYIRTNTFNHDIYTILSNITGLPSITIPLGINKNSIPFGVQVIGNPFDEVNLLSLCKHIQEVNGLIIPFDW